MIKSFLFESISWLGYLQRGEVILQIILMTSFVVLEKQIEKESLPALWVNSLEAGDVYSDVEILDLSEMVLPNIITPDNNGNNDRFMPFVPGHESTNVLSMMDTYHIQVYNRWGDVLFENDGMPVQWDGRANGDLVDSGSYIVSVSYEATCGGTQTGDLRTTLEVIR